MSNYQTGIVAGVTGHARYLNFSLMPDCDPREALKNLAHLADGESCVVGLGESLLHYLGVTIPGMRSFPASSASAIDVPSTPAALWCWLRGEDRGDLLHRSRAIEKAVSSSMLLVKMVDAYQHLDSRDLTGYEDGTENPEGDEALAAAFCSGKGAGMDGSSFVAVQQWLHDLDYVESLERDEMDNIIGRRLSDNEELDDAPRSAHVKRTAQEDFEPEAFVLRRSMPWSDEGGEGLVFVAFGHSLDAFEAQLKRMMGMDDGITDAIFRISQPVSGSYFWCPPVSGSTLDLSQLGI